MKKRFFITLALALAVILSGCLGMPQKPVEPDDSLPKSYCVYPESDNGTRWNFEACVDINAQVYTLMVEAYGEIKNHSELNASGSGGGIYGPYGSTFSYSFRMWQEGKGVLPVRVLSISPELPGVAAGDYILLKTSDLKAIALPSGAKAQFICNQDVEVLSPIDANQTLTTDRLTYELDDCRMTSPNFVPPQQ